jgi:lipopolysaccharide export system permease protein
MRLHDRYLFRELLTPLAICLGGFMIFWVSIFFFQNLEKIQEAKLNLLDSLEFCAASLPEFFVLLLPVLLLLVLLYALTHHARHNEITALRSAGLGLWRICTPYFVVGLIATGVYFALNEFAVPRCDRWVGEIKIRHVKPAEVKNNKVKSFNNGRVNRHWTFSDFNPRTGDMVNPSVQWTLPDGSWRTLQAARAVRTNGVWTFYDVQFQSRQVGAHGEPVRLPSTNVLAMPQFDEKPEKILLLMKFADTQTWLGSATAEIPLTELWEYLRHNPGLSRENTRTLLTRFHERLAAPWTCLVVVLMAIPFGAPSGRRNLFFGVAGSIFICFAYFVLQRVSLAFGLNGQIPGWLGAWLPNFVFAAAGIVLTSRVR